MKNYEDKIYSLGETVTGQTQAMSQAVQKTLENNGGVGIMTGYYDQNLSVLSVSNLLLHSTGYTFDSFMKQTNGSLKNFFYGEEDILDRDRFLQLHGARESQILTADGTVPRHYFPVFSVLPVTGPVSVPLQSHLKNRFCLHNFPFYKNPLSVLCFIILLLSAYREPVPASFVTYFCIQKGHLPKSCQCPYYISLKSHIYIV